MTITVRSDDLWNPCKVKSDIWHPGVKPVKWKAKTAPSVKSKPIIVFQRKRLRDMTLLKHIQINTLQLWLALIHRMSEVLNAESIASILSQQR